jgi:hypothetical protein
VEIERGDDRNASSDDVANSSEYFAFDVGVLVRGECAVEGKQNSIHGKGALN